MTDVKALKRRMDESGMSVIHIAEKAGIMRGTLYNRMKTGDFRLSEICSLARVLHLTREERDQIFFANQGELKSHKS